MKRLITAIAALTLSPFAMAATIEISVEGIASSSLWSDVPAAGSFCINTDGTMEYMQGAASSVQTGSTYRHPQCNLGLTTNSAGYANQDLVSVSIKHTESTSADQYLPLTVSPGGLRLGSEFLADP